MVQSSQMRKGFPAKEFNFVEQKIPDIREYYQFFGVKSKSYWESESAMKTLCLKVGWLFSTSLLFIKTFGLN